MNALTELQEHRIWVGWKIVRKNGKDRKFPVNPHTGLGASSSDPSTWASFSEATEAVERYGLRGVSHALTPEVGIVGIDLDNVAANRRVKGWAATIIKRMRSYSEFSVSTNGVHILVKGTAKSFARKPVEVYTSNRFFIWTGDALAGGLPNSIEHNQEGLNWLIDTYNPPHVPRSERVQYDGNLTEDIVRAMLSTLPPHGEYSYWQSITAAVYSIFPNDTGISLVESWSPGSVGEVERMFRSYDRNFRGQVTAGTLFYYAKQNGWKPPLYQRIVDDDDPFVKGYRLGYADAQAGREPVFPLNLNEETIKALGFTPVIGGVDQETGEIIDDGFIVRYVSNGECVNVEYTTQAGSTYEFDDQPAIHIIDPETTGPIVILPDTLQAARLYLEATKARIGTMTRIEPDSRMFAGYDDVIVVAHDRDFIEQVRGVGSSVRIAESPVPLGVLSPASVMTLVNNASHVR